MIFTSKEKSELQGAIDRLNRMWPTQQIWEKKAASVTPKLHDLWFEVPQQLTYLVRFYHFMEDPIEKLHKIDRIMYAVYCHLQDYECREESKRKQEAICKNYAVKLQMQQVTQSCKRNFSKSALLTRGKTRILYSPVALSKGSCGPCCKLRLISPKWT